MDVTAIIIAASIPSALTGFCFWLIEQRLQKRAKKQEDEEKQRREAEEKREKLREQQELFWCRVSEPRSLSERQPPRPCSGSPTLTVMATCTPRWNMRQR